MQRLPRLLATGALISLCSSAIASQPSEQAAVERAARDYIESQHIVDPKMMERGIHPKLSKQTYWVDKNGDETIMLTDYQTMIEIAASYNEKGDRFPENPRADIEILDIDQRVASVKLTADEWIDYMHLFKDESGNWKVINVLWQYHNTSRHQSNK